MCRMMSFGLTNASAYYMDLMNTNFMEYLDKFIIVFIVVCWFAPRVKKNMKNISVWYRRSFQTLDCMSK
jgi:accessory gene regulator protein AgrB